MILVGIQSINDFNSRSNEYDENTIICFSCYFKEQFLRKVKIRCTLLNNTISALDNFPIEKMSVKAIIANFTFDNKFNTIHVQYKFSLKFISEEEITDCTVTFD